MEFIFDIFIFIFGLCIGSFLNVVVLRLEKGEGFVAGRSYCPHCRHVLSWIDLVPVFSFLFLRGKCRYCKVRISWQYPVVELATGLIFLLIFNFQFSIFNQLSISEFINLFFLLYVVSSLIIIVVYDLKYYLIPDSVLFPAIIITFLYRVIENLVHWALIENWSLKIENFAIISNFMIAVIIASGFFLVIFLVSRGRAMGFGDVKLAVLLGLLLGFPDILVALFLSFLFGAIIGVALMIFQKKGLKSEVPFAPFLIAGTLVAMLWGAQLLSWYFSFLM